jgi:hypothetical protein
MSADNTIRELLCKYFQSQSNLNVNNINVNNQKDDLEKFAHDQGLECPNFDDGKSMSEFMSELWAMVMERIIEPVWGEIFSNETVHQRPPYIKGFRLTKYGRKLLEGLPIDRPDQYIDYLKDQVKTIDAQVIVYVRESLESYKLGCYFAASVMLGVASELIFESLIDTYTNAIPQNAQAQFRKKTDGKSISIKYEEFKKKLPDIMGVKGLNGKEGFKHAIEVTLDTIRSYRNYAAHSHDGMVPRHIIMCNLNAFPIFCERLYNVIEWFKHNGI